MVAKGMHRARYHLPPLLDLPLGNEEYSSVAQYVFMDFLKEINSTSIGGKLQFVSDLDIPSTVIDFAPQKSIKYPNAEEVMVHGKFSLKDAILEEDLSNYIDNPGISNAVLVEHLHSGLFFAIYYYEGEFKYFRVYDFDGTREIPNKVQEMHWFGMPDGWEKVDPYSPGTRVGGIPLNFDGTPYMGPWPGAVDGKFSFVAQYQLEDGRYLHIFQNYHAENYDYAELMPDDEKDDADPYSIVLLDGASFGLGFVIDRTNERTMVSPDIAYARKPLKNATKYHGVWVQDEVPPNDRNYELLMHFGDGAECDGKTIIDNISYAFFHLFFNRKTGRAKVIMQCT